MMETAINQGNVDFSDGIMLSVDVNEDDFLEVDDEEDQSICDQVVEPEEVREVEHEVFVTERNDRASTRIEKM